MSSIDYELIALIVTVLGGFATLSYQVGKRTGDIDGLTKGLEAAITRITSHEEECSERHIKIDGRLAEGSSKMAILEERSKATKDDVREIRNDVREIKDIILKGQTNP